MLSLKIILQTLCNANKTFSLSSLSSNILSFIAALLGKKTSAEGTKNFNGIVENFLCDFLNFPFFW